MKMFLIAAGALTIATTLSFGQQLTLTLPGLGSYNATDPATEPPTTPLTTPITVAATPGAVAVTVASTDFLYLTASSTSCAGATQSITVSVPASGTAAVYVCLVGLHTGGTFLAVVSATAAGYTSVSYPASTSYFPGGSINVNPSLENVSSGAPASPPQITASGAIGVGGVSFAPGLATSWLAQIDSSSLTCNSGGTNCTVTITPNPYATGLVPGSTYTAAIAFIDQSNGNATGLAIQYVHSPHPLTFVPVTPCRVVDTRNATGAFGGPILSAGQTREFDVPNGPCSGIPSSAVAYSLNVTVVPVAGLSYLSIWPAGTAQPVVSTLNSDGRVKANAAIIAAGNNGGVDVYVTDNTQFILDISGYFEPATSGGLAFYSVSPCRALDTRGEPGVSIGGPYLSAGLARTIPILSSSCGLPSTAQAYALNVTAIPHTSLWFITLWPTGQSQPTVSTLNSPGSVTANAAILPAGTGGSFDVVATDDTDLVVDVNGYFAPAGAANALSFYSLPPCRAADTRLPSGSSPFIGEKDFDLSSSSCNLPSTAPIEVVNVTAIPSVGLSYLTLWQQGPPRPTVSTLNGDHTVVSNMALAPPNTSNGQIAAYSTDWTDLVFDVSGYFAP